jgi:hypothetical protein
MVASVLLLVSMSGQLQGQQREEKPGNWFTRWWKKTPATKEHEAQKHAQEAPPASPTITVNTMVLSERAYRRMEVVNKLREIAWSTNDTKLLRMADQLDQRLGESLQAGTPYAGRFRSDEQILENHLGAAPVAPPGQLTAGSRPVTTSGSCATIAGRREGP